MIDLHTFCISFVGTIRTNSMYSVYYNFPCFKVWNFFNQAFYRFEDNISFFIILFRKSINCKFLQVSLICCASAVIFCWRSFLSDFDDLILLSILSSNFCKSDLISLLKFWSVLLLPCNEFFNILNLLLKYSFSYFTS